MTNIDQFESVFKAADKAVFLHERVHPDAILIVTDLEDPAAEQFGNVVRGFLQSLDGEQTRWELLRGSQYDSVGALLQRVDEVRPDIVCLYRNLHLPAREHPYSLGTYVDVLTQASTLPVLVMPHPAHPEPSPALAPVRTVMAITDHLTGDHHLISFAARCAPPDGRLLLTHVEDEAAFERFIGVIGRVPAIDTDEAREEILQRLLKEPEDYIQSARKVLEAVHPQLRVEQIVTMGHHLSDYRRLIAEHEVDLLVLNTKDEDQLAMHGLAYPLTVELRKTPMLLL